ncbi:MAG: NADH-quinone oxidoreductase subunit NuoH [Planctomycetota bacterium]
MTQFSTPWRDRRVEYRGLSVLLAGLGRRVYRLAAPIAPRLAFLLFLSAVGGGVLFIWVAVLLSEAYLTDYPLLKDLLAVGGLAGFVCLGAVFFIWWERKVAGHIQSRPGPMRVGGWHGWAQLAADGIKLVTKEDLIPEKGDRPLFRLAPYLALTPVVVAFAALPFASWWACRNLEIGLLFILAALGVEVVGVILAGWASNSKWSLYGAMREACQMVSYEIPMGLALLLPIMTAGSLNLNVVGDAQAGGWHTWMVFQSPFLFAAALVYYIASLASCKRAPFDLPEAESELVAGYLTEYSGLRWGLFFFAEYTAMFLVSALAVILFFGAWHSPLPLHWGDGLGDSVIGRSIRGLVFAGPLWFVFKSVLLVYVQLWLRWTLPRIRIDQVLYACVQVMLPVVMLLLLGHTLWELWVPAGGLLDGIATVVLALIGACVALYAAWLILKGWYRRRPLVGHLAVDLLPGS